MANMSVKNQLESSVSPEHRLNCLIDLHLHLDGSLSLKSARMLAKLKGMELPESDAKLQQMLQAPKNCGSLVSYLTKFDLPTALLDQADTVHLSVASLCEELKEQGFIYAEIRFAPQKCCSSSLTQEEAVQAAIQGLQDSHFNGQLILCCMRSGDDNTKENLETVRLAGRYLHHGVCAVDLAGAEGLFPNERYEDIFAYASQLGVPFTIHAGEASGPQSILSALNYGAKRIGHGVRAYENEEVMQRLIDQQIPLELCPTSNINTGVFAKISDEPIQTYLEKGLFITINSDNTAVSNTNTRKELRHVRSAFHLNDSQMKQLLLNSVQAAFLELQEKQVLAQIINHEFAMQ